MSKDIESIIREILKCNKDHTNTENQILKDIKDVKKEIKSIEQKMHSMDETLIKLFDILNTISIFIEEADDVEEDFENEEWTPYDEDNYDYEDVDSYNDYEDEDEG